MTEVLQVDRDAAAALMRKFGRPELFCREIERGESDGLDTVQAMTAHRIAGQAELVEAAREVLSHRVGDLPTRGWLKDNDDSRASLAKLAAALQPLSQSKGEG